MNHPAADSAILSFVRRQKREAIKMLLPELIVKLVLLLLSLLFGNSAA